MFHNASKVARFHLKFRKAFTLRCVMLQCVQSVLRRCIMCGLMASFIQMHLISVAFASYYTSNYNTMSRQCPMTQAAERCWISFAEKFSYQHNYLFSWFSILHLFVVRRLECARVRVCAPKSDLNSKTNTSMSQRKQCNCKVVNNCANMQEWQNRKIK